MADTYLKLHDGLPENRKIVAVGGDAGWLHVCALAYSSRNLTDGRIPRGMVPRLSDRKNPAKLAGKLVDVTLWHVSGHDCPRCPQPEIDEYVIHDYLKHQRSAEKVGEIKAKRAVAGRRGGTRKAANAKQTPSNLPGAPEQSTGAGGVVTKGSTPTSNKSADESGVAKEAAPANADQITIDAVHGPGPSSNLLDGCQEVVEAKPTPDTEVVLRTTRTEQTLPPTAGTATPRPDAEATTGTLVAEWLDHCQKRPPGQVIGQIGKHVKSMLGEGIEPDDIRRGLAQWMNRKIAATHLPGVVNDVMNAPPTNGRDSFGARGRVTTPPKTSPRNRWMERE